MHLSDVNKRFLEGMHTAVRRTWMKYALRGVSGHDAYDRLDRAYRVPDPWAMDSDRERFRFVETNRAIVDAFGRIGSMLEIGCGEGHQSTYLVGLCDRLTGIDVSATAVGRAQKRLPGVEFSAGDIFAQSWVEERSCFDVVLGLEMLYYLSDIPKTLAAMTRLARRGCMVSYFAPAERRMGRFVSTIPGVRRHSFRYDRSGEAEWTVVWWPAT